MIERKTVISCDVSSCENKMIGVWDYFVSQKEFRKGGWETNWDANLCPDHNKSKTDEKMRISK